MTDVAHFDRESVTKLIIGLQEATRAKPSDEHTSYIPVSGGEVATAQYHHFVFGQRGAGKSSLLRDLERQTAEDGKIHAWLDQEIFSNLHYPDVLVSAVALVFEAALLAVNNHHSGLKSKRPFWQRASESEKDARELKGLLANASEQLQFLKFAPIDRQVEWTVQEGQNSKFGVGVSIPRLNASGNAEVARSTNSTSRETVVGSKDEYLERSLIDFKRLLTAAAILTRGGFIFIDDLYQITRADQSLVVGYMHRLVKDTNLWLKMGSIRYSTEAYKDGDPPRGMQVGHDAHEVALDRGMRHFASTQLFLERMLVALCERYDVDFKELFTKDARKRMVLAAGGVARDYLRISSAAIQEARNRGISSKAGSDRITVEDVNKGAGLLAPSKREELQKDEPTEAASLMALVQNLTEFCRKQKSAYFLVPLDNVELSAQVNKLQHLRFTHLLEESETVPDQGQQRFNVWLLDVAELSAQRATVGMDFLGWEDRSKRRARRLVYRGTESTSASLIKPKKAMTKNTETETLF